MPYDPYWQFYNTKWAQGPGGMGTYSADTGASIPDVGPYGTAGTVGPGYSGGGGGRFGGGYYGVDLSSPAGKYTLEDYYAGRGEIGERYWTEEQKTAMMMKDVIDETMGRGRYDRTESGGGDDRLDPGRGGLGGGPLKKGGYEFGLGYGPGNQALKYVDFESDPHPVSMYDHPYSPEMWDDQNFGPSKFRGPGGIHDYLAYDSEHRQKGLRDIGKERYSRETAGRLDRLLNKMKRRSQGYWGRA